MAQFLIAGAGIAGLSAAIALTKSGHTVDIVEQSTELSGEGAGIQLGPNAMRILMDWGLGNDLLKKGFEPDVLLVRDAKNDRILTTKRLDDARAKYGAPHLCILRSDLQQVLLSAVRSASIGLVLGKSLKQLQEEQMPSFDVLLGCDGVHSAVREELLFGTRHAKPAKISGYTAYRAILNQGLLPIDMRTCSAQLWLGVGMHAVTYPINATHINIVFVQKSGRALDYPKAKYLRTLMMAIMAQGGFTEWPLYYRPPMRRAKLYAKGNVALLGDAAHPMLPYLAQGAGMAIEDAQALAVASQGMQNGSEQSIQGGLLSYAKNRLPRNVRMQRRSYRMGFIYHAGGLARWIRNALLRLIGSSLTAQHWLYDYRIHFKT